MKIRFIISTVFCCLILLKIAYSADRPNIVVILTDDQGYADISFNPEHPKEVDTPHMDALAKEGVFFTQAYTSGHVCSPTRAGLMLGRYQQRVGVYTAGDGGRGFDPKLPIFPAFLPDEYTSMAIGKWHLGLDNDYPELKWHAMSRGFDEAYKFMGRGGHDYFESKGVNGDDYAPVYRDKTRIPADEYEGYLTTRLTEEAVAFIDRQMARSTRPRLRSGATPRQAEQASPFFLYLAYNAVHAPAQAPREDIDHYRNKFPGISERRAILMAMLYHLDEGVGSVVKKLKDTGAWENTLLFFLTDNGGSKAMQADNGSLRGFKGSLFEGGIRTPWIASWPKKFSGGRSIDTPVISLDILPTALDALGVAAPNETSFDGKSLLPLLSGKSDSLHSELYWNSGEPKGEWAVRQGDWKAHGFKEKYELYNLTDDPSETKDLSKKNSAKAKELFALHAAWHKEMKRSEHGGVMPAAEAGSPVESSKLSKAEKEKRRAERKAKKE